MMRATELAARWNLRAVHGRREWRGTCPACDYRNAFVVTERNGRALLWCASCQDRDAIDVLLRGAGRRSDSRAHRVSDQDHKSVATQKKAWSQRLWAGATPRGLHDIYLNARGLCTLARSRVLRFHPDCPYPGGGKLPAMLALVQNIAGEPVAVHRTYLREDGTTKADVEPPRASLGPISGGAIRLHSVAEEIVIGEGVESSGSAGVLLGLPAWAAISAGNLASGLLLPPEVRAVVIAADADANGNGQDAAAEAAARWQAEGRRVRIAITRIERVSTLTIFSERSAMADGFSLRDAPASAGMG